MVYNLNTFNNNNNTTKILKLTNKIFKNYITKFFNKPFNTILLKDENYQEKIIHYLFNDSNAYKVNVLIIKLTSRHLFQLFKLGPFKALYRIWSLIIIMVKV